MVTAEELTVAIKSEGVGKTQQDLEGVERAMDDTADAAGDSAAELEGFSERFSGAMSAAVTALAVGAAGLLSQVPVLGESFAGLAAIVEAVAFQMDGVLRPVLNPLTNLFYEIANAIFEADGILGSIIGALASLVSIATVVIVTVAAVGAQLGVWASTFAGVAAILGKVVAGVGALIAAIGSLPAAALAAIAAIIAFAAAYALNLGGVRDKTNAILGKVWDLFTGLASDLVTWASDIADDAWDWGTNLGSGLLNGVANMATSLWDFFTGIAGDLVSWASGLAKDAFDWGISLMQGLLDGILSLAEAIVSAIEDVVNRMTETIDAAISKLPDDVTSRLGIEQIGSINVDTSFGGRDAAANAGEASGPARTGNRATNTERTTQIDGRQLSESTGRYRSDPGRRRGL